MNDNRFHLLLCPVCVEPYRPKYDHPLLLRAWTGEEVQCGLEITPDGRQHQEKVCPNIATHHILANTTIRLDEQKRDRSVHTEEI